MASELSQVSESRPGAPEVRCRGSHPFPQKAREWSTRRLGAIWRLSFPRSQNRELGHPKLDVVVPTHSRKRRGNGWGARRLGGIWRLSFPRSQNRDLGHPKFDVVVSTYSRKRRGNGWAPTYVSAPATGYVSAGQKKKNGKKQGAYTVWQR